MAAGATLLAQFPVGTSVDFLGPRRTMLLASLMTGVGSAVFALSSSTGRDMFALGFGLMGLPAAAYPMSGSSHAALFPAARGSVVALFSGAFALSSVVFLVLSSLANAGLPRRTLFLGYAAYSAVLALLAVVVYPEKPYKTGPGGEAPAVAMMFVGKREKLKQDKAQELAPVEAVSSTSEISVKVPTWSADNALNTPPASKTPPADAPGSHFGMLKARFGMSFRSQLFSSGALALVTVHAILNVKMNVFASTLNDQLLEKAGGDVDLALTFSTVYSVLLPLAGVVVLVTGRLQDTKGPSWVYAMVYLHAMLYSIAIMVPDIRFSVVTSALSVMARPLAFSSFGSSLANMFGFRHFGKLGGALTTCIGLVNFLGQSFANYLAYDVFDTFLPLNVILAALTLLGVPSIVFFFSKQRQPVPTSF